MPPAARNTQLKLFAGHSTKMVLDCCEIVSVGKRRDGGTRYWCLAHKADATAKYGRPAERCRVSHLPPIPEAEKITIDLNKYCGGVALWGAVPPVYDTTRLPLDRGIHIHAREQVGDHKIIDKTYREVRLTGGKLPAAGVVMSEIDAIYYMVSSIFGFKMKHVQCTLCGYSHIDKDWFSLHPHQRHLCAGCGKHFRDTERGIGNPICEVQAIVGLDAKKPKKAKKTLSIRQRDFPGGIQIWGSNPAILWSGQQPEEYGIHVHAFKDDHSPAFPDDTYSEVKIDGVSLDPEMVRTLMAQNSLPHIQDRVVPLDCMKCGAHEFHTGEEAYTPAVGRRCSKCRGDLQGPGRLRKTIGNPLIKILESLAFSAPRPPQKHALGLLPETL